MHCLPVSFHPLSGDNRRPRDWKIFFDFIVLHILRESADFNFSLFRRLTGGGAVGPVVRVGRVASSASISRVSYWFCVASTAGFLASEVVPEWLPFRPLLLKTSVNSSALSCWLEMTATYLYVCSKIIYHN